MLGDVTLRERKRAYYRPLEDPIPTRELTKERVFREGEVVRAVIQFSSGWSTTWM